MEMLTQIAQDYGSVFLMLHLLALVLGLGGATYCDFLMISFLKDLKISKKEAEVIKTMSHLVLAGVMLAFVSGVMLFLPKAEILMQTPKFLVKCLIFFILMVNGFVLHQLILPRLIEFSFKKDVWIIGHVLSLRKGSFICGAVSVVSWYAIFFLGAFKNITFSSYQLLWMYFGVLLFAIITALLLERYMADKIK